MKTFRQCHRFAAIALATLIGSLSFVETGLAQCPTLVHMEQYDRPPACDLTGAQVDTFYLIDSEHFQVAGQCTADGWTTADLSGRGDFAGLFQGYNVLQEVLLPSSGLCHKDLGCLWAFVTNSDANYGCGTHPEQLAVPYEDPNGKFIFNEIWSPAIHLFGYGSGMKLEFSVYRDLPYDRLVFYVWHVRSKAGGVWGPWRDRGLVYYGGQKDWLRHSEMVGALIDTHATDVQIALGAWDMCGTWCGVIGNGTCHSHAPLFDEVRLDRIGPPGPQWSIRDMDQFQDNFPADGTTTGCVRADMAADISSVCSPTILPGDSAVVTVADDSVGVKTVAGAPEVYIYVRVQNGGLSSKSGAALSGGPRFPYVDTVNIPGKGSWDRLRLDYQVPPVPNSYCIDLNDCYFTPCDTVNFFYGATNNDGVTTYAYGAKLDCQGPRIDEAAANAAEFTCLPTQCCSGKGGDILYVNGMGARGVQQYFDTAFELIGLTGKVDRYDVRAPSSAVGNRLASRANVNQLLSCYRKIIWDCGDLEVTLGDGSGMPEKTDDYALLYQFLDTHPNHPGLWICGDDIAQQWGLNTGATNLSNTFMNFGLVNGDHVNAGDLRSPTLTGVGPATAGLSHVAAGDCPLLNDFDLLSPLGAAVGEMQNAASGRNYALSQATPNSAGSTAKVFLQGYSYRYVTDLGSPVFPPARVEFMRDVLLWLEDIIQSPIGIKDQPQYVNRLDNNYPNPFNPTTAISYSIKNEGHVSLTIYNAAGQLVRTLVDEMKTPQEAGFTVTWNGLNDSGQQVGSGVYFYKLVAKDFTQTKKMVLLK